MTERIICNDNGGELRKMAAVMSERGSAIGLDYGMGRGLADAARMMRDAADVIEGLEHENVKLQDENARLRSCLSDDAENARMIMGENAKLRELVREAVDAASLNDMRDWRYGKRLAFLREARELGIEVD